MEWIVFFLVFGILFLGELGDKTQLIVFNLSLEHQKPDKVGLGATLGFAVIVTIGVFFGMIVTRFVPISIIAIISGIVFIVIGILESRGLKKLYYERKQKIETCETETTAMNVEEDNEKLPTKFSKLRKNPYIAGFSFIFLMELGDKTQILTIALASIYPYPFEVWLGSFLALIALAWMGAFFGCTIAQKVPKFHLKFISVVIFIFIGVLIIITSI
ncbi:MAG: TMEM165/GDT1 family protein [Promethearchaeota archaeon]|nr:MAG: TMEM165/GDT1 family protein [Candidatus Lokiarchaeota archaeon]